jgi:glycerol-3-phosphate dehydrogenase
MADAEVVVVGAGVVGSATALALARRGVSVSVLEAEPEPGLAASGTNSGVIHTGFDSPPGELETELILRSVALRDPVLGALGVPVARCGALLRPLRTGERESVRALADNANRNGVEVRVLDDGTLEVPGEAITDPAAYTLAFAAAAERHGAELRTGFRVAAIDRTGKGLSIRDEGGDSVGCRVAVNCAGLYADRVARLAGDDSFEIYPRKGEFLVFEPPEQLDRILLPVPTKRTKGVLVFPTLDGKVAAGPTAIDQADKEDWSVRPQARDEIAPKAAEMFSPLEGAEPIAAYAGLRPAGKGVNYLIGPSSRCEGLVNVAAIRSTGLTASLGIAERVSPLDAGAPATGDSAWWRRVAEYRGVK